MIIRLSSSVPTMIENEAGYLELVIGASGGSRITSATLQCILNALVFNETMLTAITDPQRLHHQLIPNEVLTPRTVFFLTLTLFMI